MNRMQPIARAIWNAMPSSWRGSLLVRLLGAGYRMASGGGRGVLRSDLAGIALPHLEMHITHKCNLTCEGCLHFSNHGHTETLSVDDLRRSMSLWHRRVVPKTFSILGGEPCLHRDLVDIVYLTRSMWPDPFTEIGITTNGLLLHLHPRLPQALAATRTSLNITIHSDGTISESYQARIARSLDLAKAWENAHGIEVTVTPCITWSLGYRGFGGAMMPFDDHDPRTSWDNCIAGQECFQLFEDCLWKCAPLAYLRMQDRRFALSDAWRPYLDYQPLRPGCTNEEIVEFFSRKAESVCGMCPSHPQQFTKRDPLLPVAFYRNR